MQPASTAPARVALAVGLAVITLGQILRPGLNQDVRYVLGVLDSAGAGGLVWTEVWAHRPLAARGVIALLGALSPGGFVTQEILFRAWCVLLAAGAAVVLWRGLRGWCAPRVAGWVGLAVGAALAWAPGWDFAEPEWFAAVLAVAAVGAGLWSPAAMAPHWTAALGWSPLVSGALLGGVVLLKFTTAATALAALLVLAAFDRRRTIRIALVSAAVAAGGFALTILLQPREWQWLWDMPTLNPGFSLAAWPQLVEGFVNAAVVSPITVVGLVAIGWLLVQGGQERRLGLLALALFVVLAVPFVVQQQNFLYHLAALPVAAAGISAAVAAHPDRVPIALPVAGAAGLLVGVGLFAMGPRTRSEKWWVAALALGVVFGIGLALLVLRRGLGGWLAMPLIALTCLAPLLVTVSPKTAYSFSLAHNRVTPRENLSQARAGADRLAEVRRVLPADRQVIYLSFSAPYWVANPTPCRYVSPTFLQRASGERGHAIAATPSYAENLACLSDERAQALVIEPGWFSLDRARPEVRAAVRQNFDCDRQVDAGGWQICPRR